MDSKMNSFLKYCLVPFSCIIIMGCSKLEQDFLDIVCTIQSDDLIGLFNTANGETLRFSIGLDRDQSTSNLSMKQIEVFMNNIKIAEYFNNDSLKVNYQLNNKTIGQNPLRVTLKASAPNYRETIVHYNMIVNVYESKPIYGFDLLTSDVWSEGSNATISIREVDDATIKLEINTVSIFLDDEFIGSMDGEKSSIVYNVRDISRGEHHLSAIINCSTCDGQVMTDIIKSRQIKVQ